MTAPGPTGHKPAASSSVRKPAVSPSVRKPAVSSSGRKPAVSPSVRVAGRARTRQAVEPFALGGTGEPASKRALRKQGRQTMRKLLDAAMVVFARRGYHAARVDDIVKVARTSHGTFYLYFSNKEDLLRALVSEAAEEVAGLDSVLGPVGPGPEGWQELRTWIDRFSLAWQRYAPVIRAWTDLVMNDSELSDQAHAAASGVSATLVRRIAEAGPPEGIDPVAAAEAVVAMVDRFHYLRQFSGEPVDAQALDTLTTLIHRGLFGAPGTQANTQRKTPRKTRRS